MSYCNSKGLALEKYSKTRPTTYFFWLPPVCPWHVFLPAKAAGFPETGWSCCLLGLMNFCGDWSSEGVLYSCQALPCVFCSVCYCNKLPDCTNLAGYAWIAAGHTGLGVQSEKHSSEAEGNVLLSSGSQRTSSLWLTDWSKKEHFKWLAF